MAIDLTPEQKTEMIVAWPFVGPFIQSTLKSLEETFSNHSEQIFTGADIATILNLASHQIEEMALGGKEINAREQ